jgi:hypothetical protein
MPASADQLWKHLVIDDFLMPDDFEALSDREIASSPPDKVVSLRENRVHADGRIVAHGLDAAFLQRLQSRYHQRSMDILRDLAPEKVKLYEYSWYELNITGSRCSFPIHDDVPRKLLSMVVYLKPEKNTGTLLYASKSDTSPVEVPWKPNRALIFSRIDQTTWHAYQGDGQNNRLALVYNLMTSDIRGVYRAEGKSYLGYQLNRARQLAEKIGARGVVQQPRMQ